MLTLCLHRQASLPLSGPPNSPLINGKSSPHFFLPSTNIYTYITPLHTTATTVALLLAYSTVTSVALLLAYSTATSVAFLLACSTATPVASLLAYSTAMSVALLPALFCRYDGPPITMALCGQTMISFPLHETSTATTAT